MVVLSNNDGCVIARSNEAKALGIPMGAPAFKYKELFNKHQVAVFSSNFALYGDMSGRVMRLLSEYAPAIEVYSIDEAFLNLDNCDYLDLDVYGEEIRKTVTKSTGIPVSVGFAETKALSKIANRIAKKYPKETGGVYSIDTEEKRIKALKWLKIGDVWGIGRKHTVRLQQSGIDTAYQLTQKSDAWVRQQLSVVGLRLKYELLGERMHHLETQKQKKSISTTRTFETTYSKFSDVSERVATFAVTCATKLRQQKTACKSIMVFLLTNRFSDHQEQYSRSVVIKLPFASNSSIELTQFATTALKHIFRAGYHYKKAGVI